MLSYYWSYFLLWLLLGQYDLPYLFSHHKLYNLNAKVNTTLYSFSGSRRMFNQEYLTQDMFATFNILYFLKTLVPSRVIIADPSSSCPVGHKASTFRNNQRVAGLCTCRFQHRKCGLGQNVGASGIDYRVRVVQFLIGEEEEGRCDQPSYIQ